MNLQTRSYQFRIYPNPNQTRLLNQTFGSTRFYWNYLVSSFLNKQQPKTEPELKREFEWLNLVSAASLQQKRRDFEQTKKQFFNKSRKKKLGKMKFKKKGKSRESYRLPNQKFSIDYNKSLIRLEKIGSVKIIIDRPIPKGTKINNCTISKNSSNQFFVSVSVIEDIQTLPLTGKKIGIDLGLKELFTSSDGLIATNPSWFRKNQTKLKSAQRHLSRKQYQSNRYHKQRLKVARIHTKIRNQRNDYLHNLSINLIKNYDLISVEDLNLEGMKRKFGKSVSDIALSEFVRQLEYKALFYGKQFIKIDRFFSSTQLCSHCGAKTGPKGINDLDKRTWVCDKCGTEHNRDQNAAINILREGYKKLTSVEKTSAELVDYGHREDISQMIRLMPDHLQSSMKCLESNDMICHENS